MLRTPRVGAVRLRAATEAGATPQSGLRSRLLGENNEEYGDRFRRDDRRCGNFRHRHGGAYERKDAGPWLRHRRTPRESGRDLGSVPLSRHPLGQRHAYAGLRFRTVEARKIDRRWPRHPRLSRRHRRRARHPQAHPLRAQGARGRLARERGALACHAGNERRRAQAPDRQLALSRIGLLRLRRGL